MKRNLITRTVGSVLVLRQTNEDPSDVEWSESLRHLGALLRTHGSNVKALVYTEGGAPTIPQRKLLAQALSTTPIRAAVVSDDVKARFTSSTVALGNRNHRSFSVAELPKALIHLGLTPDEAKGVEDVLAVMAPLLKQ